MILPNLNSRSDCKAVITKIDKYEIHLKNDNTYYSAKSEAGAKKIAEQLEREAVAEFEKHNSAEAKELERLKSLSGNVEDYIDLLKKQLWDLQHHKTEDMVSMTRLIDTVKGIKDNLQGFVDEKLLCVWHQNYLKGDSYYTIEKTESVEDKENV